jgi:hypothetical protein
MFHYIHTCTKNITKHKQHGHHGGGVFCWCLRDGWLFGRLVGWQAKGISWCVTEYGGYYLQFKLVFDIGVGKQGKQNDKTDRKESLLRVLWSLLSFLLLLQVGRSSFVVI